SGGAAIIPTDGTVYFKATVTDGTGGNTSQCSGTSFAYTADNTAPAAPSITSSTPTNAHAEQSRTPTINGSAENNATINIFSGSCPGGTVVGTGSANAVGAFAITLTSQLPSDGVNSLFANATDAATNTSTCSGAFSYTTDNTL